MPGVPSGRACEACRKQKKKCDELQPTCSRCQRLNVPCVGSGAKRYKWSIETTNRSRARGSPNTSTTIVRTTSSTPESDAPLIRQINRSPSNTQTVLAMTLIDKVHLGMDSDLRYNLTWAFGTFIQEVPRRLGENAALDAAATSLALSHVRYSTGRRDPAPEEIKAHINALSVLRKCLDDPVVARDANTLCAVMLLLFCQQMLGWNGTKTSGHGEGAAIILKAKGIRYDPDDEFEDVLLQTLRGPLLFEGLFNTKIKLDDDEWDFLIKKHAPKATPTDVTRLVSLWASFPRLTAAVRDARKSESMHNASVSKDLVKYSRELYSTSILILDRLRAIYLQSIEDVKNIRNEASASQTRFLYAFDQRMYSMAVFTACYFNCLIRAMLPVEERSFLRAEATGYAKEIVTLAYHGMASRPLGSAFMPVCLMVAWFTPMDAATRDEISNLWDQYKTDFPATKGLKIIESVDSCRFLEDR